MSGAAIIKNRINELAVFVKSGEPFTADKKKEFAAKWDLSQRMVERYYKKEVEETLNDNSKRDFNDIKETAKKMHRKVLSAVSKLCAIADGEYESEKNCVRAQRTKSNHVQAYHKGTTSGNEAAI